MKKITIGKNETQILTQDTLESREITLEQGAKLTYILGVGKGSNEQVILKFNLNGKDAQVNMIGLFAGQGEEHFDLRTETHFNANHTCGHITIKGIMTEKAKTNYFGLIRIPKGMQDTDGYVGHHTLLLSKEAQAKSIPSLEIEANEVTCGHSASVGQVDERAIFYLMSRGLTESQAKNILIEAFFEELLEKIEDAKYANTLRKKLFTITSAAGSMIRKEQKKVHTLSPTRS